MKQVPCVFFHMYRYIDPDWGSSHSRLSVVKVLQVSTIAIGMRYRNALKLEVGATLDALPQPGPASIAAGRPLPLALSGASPSLVPPSHPPPNPPLHPSHIRPPLRPTSNPIPPLPLATTASLTTRLDPGGHAPCLRRFILCISRHQQI
mmetsp:Transcript_8034/g.25037  ORF Transcript_8034/g.25037 Transcript_8034/m.25037 type:complete len:149 (-) Transcript_8034:78-524(-)|eukprot:scaffold206257_cov35-Tisochrysis_lutea.AAC.1